MLITSTVDICIQQLGRVEEMVFTARRSYASAVLEVVILSACLSVCHTRALWLIQRTYRRYFYTTWKGNPSGQIRFFVQLCSSWQDFNWLRASRGPSAIAELLVYLTRSSVTAEGLRDALCQLKYCQLLHSCIRKKSHFKRLVYTQWTIKTWHFIFDYNFG